MTCPLEVARFRSGFRVAAGHSLFFGRVPAVVAESVSTDNSLGNLRHLCVS